MRPHYSLVLAMFYVGSAISADMRNMRAIGLERVNGSLNTLRLIQAGEMEAAQAQFRKLDFTGCPLKDAIIAELEKCDLRRCTQLIDLTINFWIVQEAGHTQHPPLTLLLDHPARLAFLQELALYRASLSAPDREAANRHVAPILEQALVRRNTAEETERSATSSTLPCISVSPQPPKATAPNPPPTTSPNSAPEAALPSTDVSRGNGASP